MPTICRAGPLQPQLTAGCGAIAACQDRHASGAANCLDRNGPHSLGRSDNDYLAEVLTVHHESLGEQERFELAISPCPKLFRAAPFPGPPGGNLALLRDILVTSSTATTSSKLAGNPAFRGGEPEPMTLASLQKRRRSDETPAGAKRVNAVLIWQTRHEAEVGLRPLAGVRTTIRR